ncbi:TetR/AcrR family transcriptional regulator [Subtercola lobariae]|uniref:TetR family transcriptional regulator n=1 Tax=Subtercola lobariae TaxID=1588641 RepID=A0A917BAY9_9MICO|nr:TetR/AcrR family transcriptional regulator [Subtercola lobariae]GGF35210.1 TetR family transcriptional regulator [Subtercola lobariae]
MATATSITTDAPKATRRRGGKLLQAIYETTLTDLVNNGFENLTFDKLAAATGTGKASLYRRWSTPDELLMAALADPVVGYGDPVFPDKGNIRDDLIELLSHLAESLDRPHGRAMLLVLAHRTTRPELYELVERMLLRPHEAMTLQAFEAGVERGEVDPDVVNERVLLMGSWLVTSEYNRHGQIDQSEVVAIIDEIILPVITPRDSVERGGVVKAVES